MAQTTTDHDTIRQWAEQRDGIPASVEQTADDDSGVGILRIEFPGAGSDDKLTPISWNDFFEKFESSKLAFLYQDETADGEISRFCKFVSRE